MSTSRPFFTSPSGEFDTGQVLYEVIPLAKLVGAVALVALVPILMSRLLYAFVGIIPLFGLLLSAISGFVLAVGAALVLLYVVVRALQLADR